MAEDKIEYGDLAKKWQLSTFGAHFVEVGVDAYTGVTRIRRMLAVCASGRIINPKSARSQVIGAMTMGVGAALMEELAVDKRLGFFVNHDLRRITRCRSMPTSRTRTWCFSRSGRQGQPAEGQGRRRARAVRGRRRDRQRVYNATGNRVRDYPITLDKHLEKLPAWRSSGSLSSAPERRVEVAGRELSGENMGISG